MARTLKAESPLPKGPAPAQALQAASGESPAGVLLPDPFALYRGGRLHGARIAYES
jgi:hypothetical protein